MRFFCAYALNLHSATYLNGLLVAILHTLTLWVKRADIGAETGSRFEQKASHRLKDDLLLLHEAVVMPIRDLHEAGVRQDAFVAKLGNSSISSRAFRSTGTQDGWVLESTETSGVGGTMNATATAFNLGDDAGDRQFRSILSFHTGRQLDIAVITRATLKVERQGMWGPIPSIRMAD